jgi:hypothetical protein
LRKFQVQTTGVYDVSLRSGKQKYSFNRALTAGKGFFNFESSSKLERPGEAPIAGEIKINVQNKDLTSSVLINIQHPLLSKISNDPQKNTFNIDFKTTKDIKNIVLSLIGKIPNSRYEAFEFKL